MGTFVIDLLSGKEYLFNGNFVESGSTSTISNAINGLTKTGTDVKLGGTLTKDTIINGAYNIGINTTNVNITGSTAVNLGGTVKITSTPANGILYSSTPDAVLVWNNSDKQVKIITGVTLVEIKTITGITYTIQNSDSGKFIEFTNTGNTTITCPTGFTKGFQVVLINIGGGNKTVTAGTGATIYSNGSAVILSGAYSAGTIYYRAIGQWVLGGNLS
jgi:hypothetical protein